MNMATKTNDEHFSFDLRNLKFDADKPGWQTTKNLIIILTFFLVLVVIIFGAIYLLKISTTGILSTVGALVGKKTVSWLGSTIKKLKGRSP